MAIKGLEQFQRTLAVFAKDEVPERVTELQRGIVLAVVRGAGRRTPVDKGFARNNWQATLGEPAVGTIDVPDPSGTSALLRALGTTKKMPHFGVAYVTNNLPYIEVLEHGGYSTAHAGDPDSKVTADGYSKQAPQGMVALTLEDIRTQFT